MAQVAVTYDSVMNDLKARQFKPVYYLMGEESYYIDQISEWLANNVLQPEERDFNQTVLFGSDVTASQNTRFSLSRKLRISGTQSPWRSISRHPCLPPSS